MAVAPSYYTITDPLLEGSYSSYVMERRPTYGLKEDGARCINPREGLNFSAFADNQLGIPTDYHLIYSLCASSDKRFGAAYQRMLVLRNFLQFNNLVATTITPEKTVDDLVLKTLNEQFMELSSFFGFNKTEWAELLSVSRPTIYGWLKDELKPSGENAHKIARLYSLLADIPNRQEGAKLFRGYMHQHLSAFNCSLYEKLSSDLSDEGEVSELVRVISSLLQKSQQKYKELDALGKTGLASRATFDYNITNLFS